MGATRFGSGAAVWTYRVNRVDYKIDRLKNAHKCSPPPALPTSLRHSSYSIIHHPSLPKSPQSAHPPSSRKRECQSNQTPSNQDGGTIGNFTVINARHQWSGILVHVCVVRRTVVLLLHV